MAKTHLKKFYQEQLEGGPMLILICVNFESG